MKPLLKRIKPEKTGAINEINNYCYSLCDFIQNPFSNPSKIENNQRINEITNSSILPYVFVAWRHRALIENLFANKKN